MSFKKITHKLLLNLNDLLQASLSLAMSNMQWLISFNATPAAFVLRPLVGLALFGILLFQAYELSQANQANFVDLLQLIGNTINVSLSNVSIFGWIGATALNTTFIAGPWIFIAALGIGFIQQIGMLGFNLYKGFESESSLFRAHHLQAAISNGINALMFGFTIAAVILTLFTPAAPMALMAFSVTTASLLILAVLWRSVPNSFRQFVKEGLGLGKPVVVEESSKALAKDMQVTLPLAETTMKNNRHSVSFWCEEVEEENLKQPSLKLY